MRELGAAVFVHWGPSILDFWEIIKWITTEWENGGSGVSGGNSVGSTMGNFTRCYWATLTWVTQWESLSAPWRGSPPGSPFSGKEKRHLFPSCGGRLTRGMMGETGLHKGRESPCQQVPLHAQVETVNTHLPYCLLSLLLLFLHFFCLIFKICFETGSHYVGQAGWEGVILLF